MPTKNDVYHFGCWFDFFFKYTYFKQKMLFSTPFKPQYHNVSLVKGSKQKYHIIYTGKECNLKKFIDFCYHLLTCN